MRWDHDESIFRRKDGSVYAGDWYPGNPTYTPKFAKCKTIDEFDELFDETLEKICTANHCTEGRKQMRVPKVGDVVVYHDSKGNPHNALVQVVWNPYPGQPTENIGLNVIYVSSDENKTDQYGRQIEHATSVSHVSWAVAHGMYWRWPDEEARPITTPAET